MKEFYITEDEDEAGTNEGVTVIQFTAHNAEEAVETYMTCHHADNDYPEETTLWVWVDGEQPSKFKVESGLTWHHSINEVLT